MEELQLTPRTRAARAFDISSDPKDGNGNRRFFARTETRIDARIHCHAFEADCSVLDLSEGGARIRTLSAKVPPRQLAVQIPGIGTLAGRVVWRGRDQFGFEFDGTNKARSGSPLPDEQGGDDATPYPNPALYSQPDVITDTVSLRGDRLQRLRKLALRQAA